jgi:ribose 5-phosphate isomerase B
VKIHKIAIGSDHGGYELKTRIVEHLRQKGMQIVDVGSGSTEIVRYPYFAAKVANMVADGEAPRGILICSTGIGMSIMANKRRGIRAALCTSSYMARMTREHNGSNILCLGGKITGEFEAIDIVDTWLHAEYQGGRHDISLAVIAEAEQTLCTEKSWAPTGPMK